MSNRALHRVHNLIEQGLDYWDSKRAGRRMPSRRDIEPTEILDLLPYVVLVDVEREPLDFRYRLVGTAVAARFGHDRTGGRCAPPAEPRQRVWKTAVRILEEKRPIVSHILRRLPPLGPNYGISCRSPRTTTSSALIIGVLRRADLGQLEIVHSRRPGRA
jgi:hypothetical protein